MGLKTSLKVGVYCTFLLGGITMIICIVRLVTLEASEVRNNLSLSLMGKFCHVQFIFYASKKPWNYHCARTLIYAIDSSTLEYP